MKYVIARAAYSKAHVWKAHTYDTPDELLENGFKHHGLRDTKEGPCYIPGELVGVQRQKTAVKTLCMFVFDIDGSQKYEELRDLIVKSGYEVWMSTTYSHMSNTTLIRTDAYTKWAASNGQPDRHTQESVEAYLLSKGKTFLKNVKVRATLVQSDDGINIMVEHDPLEKYRLILPMAETYVVMEGVYTTPEAERKWKQIYVGLGKSLGFDFDYACSDLSRLYYYPSHRGGAPHKFERFEGRLITPADYVLAAPEEIRKKSGTITGNGTMIDADNAVVDNFDVGAWMLNNGKGLGAKLEELLRSVGQSDPDFIRKDDRGNKPGMSIACPFEAEHSKMGGEGCWYTPGDDENSFPSIRCSHDHCHDRKTETFIAGLIEQGTISSTQLRQLAPQAQQEAAMRMMGLDPSTLAKVVEEPDIDINHLSATVSEDEQRNIVEQVKMLADLANPLPGSLMENLEYARSGVEVKDRIKQAIEKGAPEGRALSILCLAVSGMTLKQVKLFYGTHAADVGLSPSEFIDVIKMVREKKRPISSKMDWIAKQDIQNHELRQQLAYYAQYYGLPYSDVQTFYYETLQNNGGDTEGELVKRAELMNRQYAKWQRLNATYLIDVQQSFGSGVITPYTITSVRQKESNKRVRRRVGKKDVMFSIFDYWLDNWPDQVIYEHVIFDPGATKVELGTLNLFRGMNRVTPVAGDATPILTHLREVWCREDDTAYNWLITYLASIFQFPGTKYPTAVAISGKQGTGKSIVFTNALRDMAYPYFASTARKDDIAGRFNSVMENKLIFVAEEAVFSGDHAAASKLKDLVSNTSMTIERKGLEPDTVNNYVRLFFLTNDHNVLKIEPDDRRYLILECSEKYRGNKPYFKGLAEWLDKGGREAFMHFLLNWNPEDVGMSWSDLQEAPKTTARVAQIGFSAAPPEKFGMALAMDGSIESLDPEKLRNGLVHWRLDGPTTVAIAKWNENWQMFLKEHANGAARSHQDGMSLAAFKRLYGDDSIKHIIVRPSENAQAVRCYQLMPRRDALTILLNNKVITEEQFAFSIEAGDPQ